MSWVEFCDSLQKKYALTHDQEEIFTNLLNIEEISTNDYLKDLQPFTKTKNKK